MGIQLAWLVFLSQLGFLVAADADDHCRSYCSVDPSSANRAKKMHGLQQPGSGSLPALSGLRPGTEKPLPPLQLYRRKQLAILPALQKGAPFRYA